MQHLPAELWEQVRRALPIACVDLLVEDGRGEVLLVRRADEPCAGCWWTPGGRVLHGETRRDAAARKLREECGLDAVSLEEIGTHDLILGFSHAVTTLFRVRAAMRDVRLDASSIAAEWRPRAQWRDEALHDFVRRALA